MKISEEKKRQKALPFWVRLCFVLCQPLFQRAGLIFQMVAVKIDIFRFADRYACVRFAGLCIPQQRFGIRQNGSAILDRPFDFFLIRRYFAPAKECNGGRSQKPNGGRKTDDEFERQQIRRPHQQNCDSRRNAGRKIDLERMLPEPSSIPSTPRLSRKMSAKRFPSSVSRVRPGCGSA